MTDTSREAVERWIVDREDEADIFDDVVQDPMGAFMLLDRAEDLLRALYARIEELERERDALAERDARIRQEAYRDGWVNGSNGVAPPNFPDATFGAQEDR